MQHIVKSIFRRGEYTALAGTSQTLTHYRIYRHHKVWTAIPLIPTTTTRDPEKACLTCDTLRELDQEFQAISANRASQ